jgi:hypothetical protein
VLAVSNIRAMMEAASTSKTSVNCQTTTGVALQKTFVLKIQFYIVGWVLNLGHVVERFFTRHKTNRGVHRGGNGDNIVNINAYVLHVPLVSSQPIFRVSETPSQG